MPPTAALAALSTGPGGERMGLSPATDGDPMTVKLAQPAFAIDWNVEKARKELRAASIELSRRGLKLAAMWAAEQLIGLVSPVATPLPPNTPLAADFSFASLSDDLAIFAKTIFDQGEYARAASFLSAPNYSATTKKAEAAGAGDWVVEPPLPNLTEYGIFIRAYSLYLAGERRKEEQVVELRDPLERTTLRNAVLPQLSMELNEYYAAGKLDSFGLYIYGVVLKDLTQSSASTGEEIPSWGTHPSPQHLFMESILDFPYNWSAWLDLAELCITDPIIHPQVEELLKPIASHWMYHFFCVHVFVENQANENAIMVMERLIRGTDEPDEDPGNQNGAPTFDGQGAGMFSSSYHLQSQSAVAHYNLRDFDMSQTYFEELAKSDPHRLTGLDVYSNILYVREDKVALSQLAHRAVRVDKYRPETCCVVGNYYSLKGQHERAVLYFQRALKLDRSYLSAWTLMGHEYVEMKNTAAAIEAYRRAVDINARDYRAWYGLGQTYEIMNMLLYALFYYRKAAALRPYDARMWCAAGGCYLGLGRRADAIRSYERAVSNHDAEGVATRSLAALYREDGDSERAARCYLRHLELSYHAANNTTPNNNNGANNNNSLFPKVSLESVLNLVQVDGPEAEALLYLAYYYRDNGEYETAAICASRLLEYPGPEKEESKALLREIRSRMERGGSGVSTHRSRTRRAAPSTPRRDTMMDGNGSSDDDDANYTSNSTSRRGNSSYEFSPF